MIRVFTLAYQLARLPVFVPGGNCAVAMNFPGSAQRTKRSPGDAMPGAVSCVSEIPEEIPL